MRAELRDSLESLFPDSVAGQGTPAGLTLDAARGATLAVHVLINGLTRGAALRFKVSEGRRGLRDACWFQLMDVPVRENTGFLGMRERDRAEGANRPNPFAIRRAPFRVYDPMVPAVSPARAAGGTAALRLHVPVPPDAAPGERIYTITIEAGGDRLDLPFRARIHGVRIPAAGESSYPYTNWFSLANMAHSHGCRLWSPAHWSMIRRYAELMARARQNTFLLPFDAIFDVRRGRPVLDEARLSRLVNLFTDAGLHYIEGCHFGRHAGDAFATTSFNLVGSPLPATSAAGHLFLARAAGSLYAAIHRHAWDRRWLQHVADEPTPANASDYRILAGIVRKFMPGIRLFDASLDPGLAGSVDHWCPPIHFYALHAERYEAYRAAGDKLWYYTCCFPGGPWLNRFLDQPLLCPCLLSWAGMRYGFDGFLHWGLNHYHAAHDPFEDIPRERGRRCLPAGDTHIVYPGSGGPWSSLRLESQREGFEDVELLRIVRRADPAALRALLRPVIRSFTDYSRDVRVVRQARRALLEMAASL